MTKLFEIVTGYARINLASPAHGSPARHSYSHTCYITVCGQHSVYSKIKKPKRVLLRTLSWLLRCQNTRECLCTRLPLLLALTGLAVGFGRKRDALFQVTRSRRLPLNSPQRPREEIKYCSAAIPSRIQDTGMRQFNIGSPFSIRRLSETIHESMAVTITTAHITEKMISCFDACCKGRFNHV